MQRLRLATVLSLGVLASCAPPDSGLRVTVTVRNQGTQRVRFDCLKLAVLGETDELKFVTIKRDSSASTSGSTVFGVVRGTDLPAAVRLQASGLVGDCADPENLKLNAQGDALSATFPAKGVTDVEIFLDPPNATLDADRDGFVAASKGGLDCRDDDPTIFPGAKQVCSNTADTDCNGQGGCDDSACTAALVCADPPDRVRITSTVTTMLRYDCVGPFRVELYNASGVRKAIRDTAVGLTSSLAGTSVHGSGTCTEAALTSLPIAYDSTFFEVWLKADGLAFGTTTLTATAARVAMPGTAVVEVHPQPVDHLEFTSPERTVSAGACSTQQVTVEFRDVMNRRTDVDAPTTVTFGSAPGDLNNANIFFTDATCVTEGVMAQLQPGQGEVSLHLRARRAGTFTLTAAPSAGIGKTQPLTVQPAAAAGVAFTNAPLVLGATTGCSTGALTVELQDQFLNAVTAAAAVPVQLSLTGLPSVGFYAGVGCPGAPQTDFTVAAGTSSVAIRALGTLAGMGTVAVASTGLLGDSQSLGVSEGSASRFTLEGPVQSPIAAICSAMPFTVQLRDSVGNPSASTSPVTFTLTTLPAADPSFGFFSGAGCSGPLAGGVLTVPANQSSRPFYFRGNRAVVNFEVRASSTLTAPGTFLTGNSIRPAAPQKLVFVAPFSQTSNAGMCSPSQYQAVIRDQFDNDTSFTAPQLVTVSSVPGGVTVGSGTCTGNSVTVSAGVSQVSFSAQHTVTTPVTPYTLTATVAGFSTSPGVSLAVTPGVTTTLNVDTPLNASANVTAGGCQQVTLTRRDSFNNNAPTAGPTPLTVSLPGGVNWLIYPSANCSGVAGASLAMNSTHTVTFSVFPRTSGTNQLTASIGGGATLQQAQVTLVVAPAAPTLIFETPNTGTGTATGAQTAGGCTQVSVARKDSFGNDVPLGVAGNLTPVLVAGTTAHTAAPCTGGNAITALPLLATDARGTFFVMATRSSPTGGPQAQAVTANLAAQNATLTLTVNPGAPVLSMSTPVGGVATVSANQCLAVTVERRDSLNNLVPLPSAMNLTVTPGGLEVFGSTDCTGTAVANVAVSSGVSARAFSLRRSAATASPMALSVTLDGQSVPLSLTVNPGPTSQLVVEGLPATLTARGCTGALVVRRRDAFNNDVLNETALTVTMSSARLSFSSQALCTSPTTGATVTIANGSAVSAEQLHATGTLAGLATARGDSVPVVANGSSTTTLLAGPASKLAYTTTPTTAVAGQCSPSIQVQLRDLDDNLVTPAVGMPFSVSLASTPGSPTFFPAAACTGTLPLVLSNAQPTGTFSFRPTTAPSSESITASGGALTSAVQVWPVAVGAPNRLAWKTDPTASVPRFSCVSAGVLQMLDVANNVANNPGPGTYVLTPSASLGSVTFYSDAACTTTTTTLSITPGQSEAPPLYLVATGNGSPVLSATATPALTAAPNRTVTITGSSGTFFVTPADQAVEAGACVPMQIERRDSGNMPVSMGTTTVNVAAGAASVTLYGTTDCTGSVLTGTTITPGMSNATVFVRGRSAAGTTTTDVSLTASDPNNGSSNGVSTLKVYPLVRRGTCVLGPAEDTKSCPLALAIPGNVINRSFLVFSSSGRPATTGPAAMAPSDQNVECHLTNSSGGEVLCARETSTGTMTINYQVVSFGRDAASGFGITVEHVPRFVTSSTLTTTTQSITAVNTARSFVLASNTMDGAVNNAEGFPVVKFTSTGAAVASVDVEAASVTPVRRVSLQVVTLGFAGAAVDHRTGVPAQSNGSYAVPTNSTAVGQTFALATARVGTDSSDVNYMCKRRFNTRVGASSVTLKRGGVPSPNSNCTTDAVVSLSVQRVSLPASAGAVTVPSDITFGNNTNATGQTSTFTAVAPHKSIAFLMTQGPGGQTAGESDFQVAQGDGDDTGPFHGLLSFNPAGDRVLLTRDTPSNAISVFSPIVVQFDP